MRFAPRTRQLLLLLHIVASVGWIGAVAVYVPLAITALQGDDVDTVRGAYVAMEIAISWVIVPLGVASLVTGVIQSLGTKWGLLLHYWVIFKLLINLLCVGVLLPYAGSIDDVARIAAQDTLSPGDLDRLRDPTHVFHSTVAIALLLVAAFLAVFKPRGVTGRGRRRRA